MGSRRVAGNHTSCPLCIVLMLAMGLWISPASAGTVFHSGTTGNCDGCHGKPVRADDQQGAAGVPSGMLKGSDPSSTCLLCHEAPVAGSREQHYVATPGSALGPGVPPLQRTPGGDFGWLKKSYRWTDFEQIGPGSDQASPGDRHGHNVVAADFNYYSDRTHTHAPGGEYPSAGLSCISCHDPHGTYATDAAGTRSGAYRLLAGSGYQPKHVPSLPVFTENSPAAVAPADYNRAESDSSTRVAYGSGMSEWCRNCHRSVHGSISGHPAGNAAKLGAVMAANYNAYVGSGNLNGSSAGSYTSLVPFEMGTDDYVVLGAAAAGGSHGPDPGAGSPNVMCLTCHRAHASGWDSMTRWNTRALFIVQNGRYPGIDDYEATASAQGRTSAETARAYYDRRPGSFAMYQRSLCNKCHVKD